jgi:hypothetical protein
MLTSFQRACRRPWRAAVMNLDKSAQKQFSREGTKDAKKKFLDIKSLFLREIQTFSVTVNLHA